MQLRPDQLDAHLARGLKPLYTIHGSEPLLAQEAADAIRAAARAQGCDERKVFNVAGAHFDWSAVLGAARTLSLFAAAQLIDIRIPSGKPGKEGGEALQRYCAAMSGDVVTLVQLPRLDGTALKSAWFGALDAAGMTLRVETPERRQMPAWLAQRLARQGQRVAEGEEGQRALAFFADRVEGNLLAAHQELQKLALLHPAGELRLEQIEAAVLDVARYDLSGLSEAIWTRQVARALRMLDALQAEGEAAVLVHWTLADDLRALARARDLLDEGRPMPLALREARIWGARERVFERALPSLRAPQLARLLSAASICDGIVKGLQHPQWPRDPWQALRRLALLALSDAGPGPKPTSGRRPAPLALHA
ncbi:MAG: DNA polymerase III subunit delta [Rubrivivax sp.]